MLRVIMLISAAIAAFLVVTRFVSIPGLPVLEDQTLIAVVLALVLLFGVSGAILATPPDAQAAYASRLRRWTATLMLAVLHRGHRRARVLVPALLRTAGRPEAVQPLTAPQAAGSHQRDKEEDPR